MYPLTSEYQARFVELNGLRNVYMPQILHYIQQWKLDRIPWAEDIEDGFEWMVEEAIEHLFNTKVPSHFPSDLGKHLYPMFPGFKSDLESLLEFLKIENSKYTRQLIHIKTIVMGNLMIIGVLYK